MIAIDTKALAAMFRGGIMYRSGNHSSPNFLMQLW